MGRRLPRSVGAERQAAARLRSAGRRAKPQVGAAAVQHRLEQPGRRRPRLCDAEPRLLAPEPARAAHLGDVPGQPEQRVPAELGQIGQLPVRPDQRHAHGRSGHRSALVPDPGERFDRGRSLQPAVHVRRRQRAAHRRTHSSWHRRQRARPCVRQRLAWPGQERQRQLHPQPVRAVLGSGRARHPGLLLPVSELRGVALLALRSDVRGARSRRRFPADLQQLGSGVGAQLQQRLGQQADGILAPRV